MKKLWMTTVVGAGLLAASGIVSGQTTTIGGNIAGRPLAITGKTSVRFDQLPANVQQVIRAQAGAGIVGGVQEGTYSGVAYSVTFVENGARKTLQFAPNGGVLNGDGGLVTTPLSDAKSITYPQLPQAVQTAVLAHAASGEVIGVREGSWRAPVYDALVQAPNSAPRHILVTQSGGLIAPQGIQEAAGASASAPAPPPSAATSIPTGAQVTGQMAFKDLGWSVQKPMLDHTGYAHIDNVQQIKMPDGRIAYRGTYMKDNQSYEITVAQDGSVVSQGLVNTGTSQ